MDKFARESSIHGVKYAFMQNNMRTSRIFWTIALVCTFCGFSFYIYLAYAKWRLDPEIIMKARERNVSDFPAPAITICSNLFARDDTANFFRTYVRFSTREDNILSKEECNRLTANLHWCQPTFGLMVETICLNQNQDEINVLEVIKESSLEVSEAFLICKEGTICHNETFMLFSDFGICYTTNMMSSIMIFNTENIHEDFKKIVTKFNNESEPLWTPEKGYKHQDGTFPNRSRRGYATSFHPVLNQTDKENICALKTFKIFFHKPNEIVTPFHDYIYLNYEDYIEFFIYPKSHKTDEALRAFSPDLRKCYFEGERKLKFFRTYSKALCEWECKANMTLKVCGCVKFSMPRDNVTKICNLKELLCALEVEDLPCKCFVPCVDVKYTYKMEKTTFNRNFFASELPETSIMSWAEFNIETDIVDEIENFMSYKLQNFISDFGGLLGLFMGCSLLSIIEIFYYIINGCFGVWTNKPDDKSDVKWARKIDDATKILIKLEHRIEEKFKSIDENFLILSKKIDEKNVKIIN